MSWCKISVMIKLSVTMWVCSPYSSITNWVNQDIFRLYNPPPPGPFSPNWIKSNFSKGPLCKNAENCL